MEIYQIKVFLEVARHLSFTEAADTLNLTQPAVSAKIKCLESELGASLFERLGRRVQLTEIGNFLFEEGPKLINLETQVKKRIEEVKQGKSGSLRIGCTSEIADGWLPNVLFKYRSQNSGIQTRCFTFESAECLYRAITEKQVNIGVSNISFDAFSEISSTPIDTICYSLIVSSNHLLASQAWLSLRDLLKEPWVLLPDGSSSRIVFETRLAELGLHISDFSQVEVVDNLSMMRTYITQGSYLGFASSLDFKAERASNTLVSIRLQEFALSGNIFLILPARLSPSPVSSLNKPTRNRVSINLTPVQRFVALNQLLPNQPKRISSFPTLQKSNVSDTLTNTEPIQALETKSFSPEPSEELVAVRLRSPSFVIRSAGSPRPETITLSIGIQNGTIPAMTAGLIIQRLGLLEHFLPQEGRYSSTQYEIQWHDFLSGAPIVKGLQHQQLDIGVLGDYPLIVSAIQNDDSLRKGTKTQLVSFVASNPDGSGSGVIVPHESKLKDIEDLCGRVVTLPVCSLAHGMVIRSLYSTNLFSKVKLDLIEHSNINTMFRNKTKAIDACAHFAPFYEIALRQGRFRSLFDGNLCGLPAFYGIVIRESLGEEYPEIVVAYLRALMAAQYWYITTPSAIAVISQWTGLDPGIISHIQSSFYSEQPSRQFFPEMQVRYDWIDRHISQIKEVPGHEYLESINLSNWVQTEFLQTARRLH